MALHRQLIKLTPVSRTFSPEPRSHWPTWAVKHDEALAQHHNNNNNTNNNNNKSMVMDAGPWSHVKWISRDLVRDSDQLNGRC